MSLIYAPITNEQYNDIQGDAIHLNDLLTNSHPELARIYRQDAEKLIKRMEDVWLKAQPDPTLPTGELGNIFMDYIGAFDLANMHGFVAQFRRELKLFILDRLEPFDLPPRSIQHY